MLISSTPRACTQPRCAHTTSDPSIPPTLRLVAHDSAVNCNTRDLNRLPRLALLVAGLLLSCVSIALAAQSGWHRGASLPESATWATAGVALAIVSLTGLSAALASHGTARRTAFTAWLLALAFVIVAGLGSQHGGRELASRSDSAVTGDRARHEAAYLRAADALATLPAARPVGVLENELAVLLKDTRLKNCDGWLENRRLRTICIERIGPLRAEFETAKARAAAQKTMDDATAALSAAKPATPTNSDATAVARYLEALGIVLPVDRLADLISLLTVVAVEIVGAVALALGRQPMLVAPKVRQAATADSSPFVNIERAAVQADPEPVSPRNQPDRPSPRGGPALGADAERRRARVVQKLMDGALEGTQESIAARVGLPKTTMRRLVEADPRLRLTVGPQGSRLELADA